MAETTGAVDGPATEPLTGSARTQFGKGRDPLERYQKRAPKEPPPLPELVPVEGEGMLRAFRHVLMNDDPRHDTEPLFKLAREIRSEDRRAFGKQFADLERAEREASAAKAGEKAGDRAADAGTAKARGLIDRLLSKAAEAAELEVQT
jgi:hypothetical protein